MKDSPQELLPKLVCQGDVAKVRRLLADTMPPLSKSDLSRALVTAMGQDRKYAPVVQLLLEHGANPEQLYSIGPVLMCAALNGALMVVKLLIKFGANPNRLHGRETALSAALSGNEIAVVEYLEGLGAKVDPTLALRYAAEYGDLPRAQRALANGADIDAVKGSPLEETPLIAAASRNQLKMVQWLLERGANPRKMARGQTALYRAIAHGKSLPVAEVLIAAGGNPDSALYHETALMAAASQGDLAMVQRLIELGANPKARNQDRGMTVLDYAKQSKNKELVIFLSGLGLTPERDAGKTLIRALKRTYGGNSREHGTGIILNAKFCGHKCQFHAEPTRNAVAVYGLRYTLEEFSDRKPPGISICGGKPDIPTKGWNKARSSAASKTLGVEIYSLLGAKDAAQSALTRFCLRLAPLVQKLSLSDGEVLHLSTNYAAFQWRGSDVESVLKRLAYFAEMLTPLVRPLQPERQLFDSEWLIKPLPKSTAAKTTHTFGGAIEPSIACPHCQSAANPIIRIDLTDPVLPKNPLKRSSLPVTWCLECGEWDPVFHDLSPATPEPLSVGRKSRPGPVPPPGTDYLPARRMMLVPLPADKKAGRKSKLGGSPSWVQSDGTPDCPSCGKPMAFVLQMASDAQISYVDLGLLYAFACPECRTLASLVQSH